MPLLCIALITTFHRLVWIIFVVCLGSHLFLTKRIRTMFIFIFLFILVYAFSSNLLSNIEKNEMAQSFIERRLLYDTVTERFLQYNIAFQIISNHFWGLGGYDTKEYYEIIAEHSMIRTKGNPVVIHNGFLATGVKYGKISMLIFPAMMVSMLIYFIRKIEINNTITLYPFYIVLIWMLSNLSNDLSNFNVYFVILVALVSGSFVSLYNNQFMSNTKEV